jgi:hypothetical protein
VVPTIFAAVIAGSPIPVALSNTCCPGLISAKFELQQQEQQQKQQKDTDKGPILNVGEKILWRNVIKRGFWHRHVEWILEITTQGIIMNDGVNGHITRLPYSDI